MDILDKLRDLHKQATTERSHYYVAATCLEAIQEIESLRKQFLEGIGGVLDKIKQTDEVLQHLKQRDRSR